jgi:hypothetical protein
MILRAVVMLSPLRAGDHVDLPAPAPRAEESLRQSVTGVSAPYQAAVSAGSGSIWCRLDLHHTVIRARCSRIPERPLHRNSLPAFLIFWEGAYGYQTGSASLYSSAPTIRGRTYCLALKKWVKFGDYVDRRCRQQHFFRNR